MILNLTPHEVALPLLHRTIPSSGLARVECTYETIDLVDGIPRERVVYGAVTGLPEQVEGTWLIVSAIVQTACPDRSDLLSPGKLIRDEKGRIIGCESLIFQK